MPILDIIKFTPVTAFRVKNIAEYTHNVARGTLEGHIGIVIGKEAKNHIVAKSEVLAQEFFRLLIPHQPETRLANDPAGVHYVLSAEVSGFRKLPEMQADDFANGNITGLGQALLIAMFLQETDAKNGNIGLDAHNRVIKIDGDWCFSEGRYAGSYSLTAEAIASLPYPKDFATFNWLDLVNQGVDYPTSKIVQPSLSQAPQFRSEVNQAMLKICLLPDRFIDVLVYAYLVDAGAKQFCDLFKARRDALMVSALKNTSFQDYLDTPQAAADTQSILNQMSSFQAHQEQLVPIEEHANLKNEVQTRKSLLVVHEYYALLYAIQGYSIGNNDTRMKDYVTAMEHLIVLNAQNQSELSRITT